MVNKDNGLRTKYPILLVHGMGFRDRKRLSYWGRIPKALQDLGCEIYFGNQEGNGSIKDNAHQLKERVDEILNQTQSSKLNVIAHSKGGLDIRYMISELEMGDKIASVTTISTPHNGMKTMDIILKLPAILIRILCRLADIWMKFCGDRTPHTYDVIQCFSTKSAKEFNSIIIDDKRVYYQSFAFIMRGFLSDILMIVPHFVIWLIEGKNDGLVTPKSAMWGEFRGIYTSNSRRGISHCDEVDLRRHRFTKKAGENISDIVEFYIHLVKELGDKNF